MFQFLNYHFSNLCLDTRFQELWLGEDKLEIEPLLYELLLYFLQHSTRIISRDELIAQVWKQGYVDDNAINRAISELRKILKVDTNQSAILKTHYKKGYRLLCEVNVTSQPESSKLQVSPQEASSSLAKPDDNEIKAAENSPITNLQSGKVHTVASTPDKPRVDSQNSELTDTKISPESAVAAQVSISPRRKTRATKSLTNMAMSINKTSLWLGSGIVSILAFSFLWYVQSAISQRAENTDGDNFLAKVKESPLTWQKGQAFFPKLSQNDRYLAYGHRISHDDNWALFIKDLTQGKKFKMVEASSHFYPLDWQDNKLIYQRRLGKYSEIWWVDMDDPNREHHKILQLPYAMPLSGSLSNNGKIFYFSHFNYNGEPGAVQGVDLRNNQRFTVTAPPPDSFGDYSVSISPDGKNLAFLRSKEGVISQVYLYDLLTQNTRLLHESTSYLLSLDWLHNSENLIFIESEQRLTTIDIKRGNLVHTRLDYAEPLAFINISSSGNIVASSGSLYGRDIHRTADCTSESEAIIESNFSDFSPAIANQIAFVSNRSGREQIWLRELDGLERQISDTPAGTKISELSWSPDKKALVGLLNRQLFVFNLPQNRWRYFPEVTGKIHMPRWSQDGQYLYFSSLRKNSRNLWQLDLITGAQQQVTFEGGVVINDKTNLGLLYFKDDLSTLYRLNEGGHSEPLVENIQLDNSNGWAIVAEQLYFVEQGKLKAVALKGEQKVRTCQQPAGRISQLTLDDQGQLYFTLMSANPMNIVSLSF